ncbi:MAG: hypothetical protein AAB429_03190 [Patescibacteria group bacterium]
MSNTPNYDAKVKAILDGLVPGERVDRLTGEKWMMTEEEIGWYKKFGAPPSMYSPLTRMKWLSAFRTSFEIFWNKHAFTGEPILSYVHPDIQIPIVSDQEWHDLDVGATPEYQREIDLARPVLEQCRDLVHVVPMGARREWKNIVNTIGVGMWDVEDCYIVFSTVRAKRAMYTYYCLENCEDIVQGTFVMTSQNCFGCTRIDRCHSCNFALESRDCINCSFIFDCRNCEDCFGATNLRNKKYVLFNEQLTKEEYQKRMTEVDLSSTREFETWKQEFSRLVSEKTIWPENFSVSVQDCIGEGMMDSLNASGFLMDKAKDIKDGWIIFDSEHLESVVISYNSQDCYNTAVALSAHNIKFSFIADHSSDVEYCFNCRNVEHCFGCVGLNRKSYCIFNKQYTQEEYWSKLDEVKCAMLDRGEYGKFFPAALSALGVKYGFNYVVAPFSADELIKIGGRDDDPIAGMRFAPYDVNAPTSNIDDVPDRIADVGDEWIGKQFFDAEANRRFSVNAAELAYRKEHGYPFPRCHYTARLKDLVASCNGPLQEKAACAKCQKEIMTSQSTVYPKRMIYCKPCYYQYLEAK